jgi:uncharacterized membrane protein
MQCLTTLFCDLCILVIKHYPLACNLFNFSLTCGFVFYFSYSVEHSEVWHVISLIFLTRGFVFYFSFSVEHSGGQRVRLELQKLSQFSVFPGQV